MAATTSINWSCLRLHFLPGLFINVLYKRLVAVISWCDLLISPSELTVITLWPVLMYLHTVHGIKFCLNIAYCEPLFAFLLVKKIYLKLLWLLLPPNMLAFYFCQNHSVNVRVCCFCHFMLSYWLHSSLTNTFLIFKFMPFKKN